MRAFLGLAALALMLGGVGQAKAGIIVTFDDLTVDRAPVPNGYGGINWGGSFILFTDHYDPYIPHSNYNSVYTPFLGPAPVVGEYRFDFAAPGAVFDGAWFSGYSTTTVKFNLYLGGSLVASSATLTPNSTPTFLDSGYSGVVDSVGVYSTQNGFYAMDDVTYSSIAAPEPATLTLLGIAVAGLAGYGWRRRKQVAPA